VFLSLDIVERRLTFLSEKIMKGMHIMQQHLFRWNPMRELAEAERRFSTLFDNVRRPEPEAQKEEAKWTPAVDVSEDGEGFLFTVELPGMKPEAVNIEVKENVLTIKGERPRLETKDNVRIHHRERPSGRFARVFRLQKPVDAERVTATYHDGLLEIGVPLRTEARSRKIPVLGS
jgi:HSP20 family protein